MWHKISFLKPLYVKMANRPYGLIFGVLTVLGFLYTLGFVLAHLTMEPKPEAVILFLLVFNGYFIIMSVLNVKRIHDICNNPVLALLTAVILFAAWYVGDYFFDALFGNIIFVLVCLLLVFIPGKAWPPEAAAMATCRATRSRGRPPKAALMAVCHSRGVLETARK